MRISLILHNSLSDTVMTFSKLDVGHKMNSYTITDLVPSTSYTLRLYLRRNMTMVEVSRLVATTQEPDYIKEHGIRKNYSAIVFIGEHIPLIYSDCMQQYPE